MAAPIAADFLQPSEEAIRLTTELRDRLRFFHWELEFPDVFTCSGGGFDAVVGNPPWEVQKPNSKEYFSPNIDPLYRTYGKARDALRQQKGYFRNDSKHEDGWLEERAKLKSLGNWIKYTAVPFGDRIRTDRNGDQKFDCTLGRGFEPSKDLHRRWAHLRRSRTGYADTAHPYESQGSADLNTYKMFLETGYRLLRDSGRLGMIVPSGIYSDKGSTGLRTLFLEQSRWEWLFSFENREKIFEIHRSFKFNPLIVQKGGQTETISTGFMHRNVHDWDEAEKHALGYPADRVVQFSPISKVLLEIRDERELRALEKAYSTGVLLRDNSPIGWKIRLSRDFHMGDDAGVFRNRRHFEQAGFSVDSDGFWRNVTTGEAAVPFYQGTLMGVFSSVSSKYVMNGSARGTWVESADAEGKLLPQYLMMQSDARNQGEFRGPRIVFRRQAVKH